MVKELTAWLTCAVLVFTLLPLPLVHAAHQDGKPCLRNNEVGDQRDDGTTTKLGFRDRDRDRDAGRATNPETQSNQGSHLFGCVDDSSRDTAGSNDAAECDAFAGTWAASLPGVATGEILDLTVTGALVLAEVTGDGGLTVTERGAVYSVHADPTIGTGTTTTVAGSGAGTFSVTLTSLVPGTPYYVRAYAKNASGTDYGVTRHFTTPIKVTTVAVGILPLALAMNETTNRVYVANNISNSVSVIDGNSDAIAATIPVQKAPYGVAVNATTDMIYVTNNYSNTVSVIDGGTNTVVATIPAGSAARAVAVNERTNTIYVANFIAASVSVIDGDTNTVSATVSVGSRPIALAINETTNKIYVANYYGDSVTVIDGAVNIVDATIPVGSSPRFIALNETTNEVYVVNYRSGAVTVIDGSDNSVETVTVGAYPWAAAVNEATNEVYVPSGETNVTVLDGATNTTRVVTAGKAPQAVAVNDTTNQIFVGNYNHDERSSAGFIVTRFDGQTLEKVGYAVSSNPAELMVNRRTNKLYVLGDGVTIIAMSPTDVTRFLPLLLR